MLSGKISNMKNRKDVNGLLKLYSQHASQMNAIHFANIFGSLASNVRGPGVAKLQSDENYRSLYRQTIDKLKSNPEWFDLRQIATITHSLAKMKIADGKFFELVANLRERIAKEGDPQHLSNICWAFATIGHKSDQLFDAVAGEHRRFAEKAKVQELSNTVWAFATLGHHSNALFHSVASQHERIVRDGNTQNLSNTSWAFAKLECKASNLFTAIGDSHAKVSERALMKTRNLCMRATTKLN